MNVPLDEARVLAALAPERTRCAQDVLEFMSACGVRFTTIPPRLIDLLTSYGLTAAELGGTLARDAHPGHAGRAPATLPGRGEHADESGVRRTAATRERTPDPSEVTRKVELLPRHGS